MNEETQVIFEERVYEEWQLPEKAAEKRAQNFPQQSFFLEKVIVAMLLGLVFLMPIFFLPIDGVFSAFAKNILFSTAVISTTLLTLFLWMKRGTLILPKSPIFAVLFFLVIVYDFSSLLSGSFSNSFFGTGGETATSFELLLSGLSLFLFAVFFRTKERVLYAFAALFLSLFALFLFQIIHLIFPHFGAVAGLSESKTASPIGAWGDLGIFSGIIVILILLTIEKFPSVGKMTQNVLYAFLFISLFFYTMAFFNGSWGILGIFSLAVSVFFLFDHIRDVSRERISVWRKWLLSPSFLVALVSFLFVFIGPTVNEKLFQILNIPPIQDIRPSFSGTYQVSRGFFLENGKQNFFGVGPNRFFIQWQKFRPKEVNYTPWWGIDFNEGVGTIPTAAATSGLLGIFGWVSFMLLFLLCGARAIKKSIDETDTLAQYIVSASFFSALYFWIVIFLNPASVPSFAFAFIFTGLFLGTLSANELPQVRGYNYSKDLQVGFVFVVILLLLFGLFVALGWRTLERTRSFFAYRNAVFAGNSGNFEKAEAEFQKAIRLSPNDASYRSFSLLNSYRAAELLLRKDISPEELRAQFGASFRASIENANMSIQFDGANYQNWLTLGNAYSLLVPLGIENVSKDAYINAVNAYEQAAKRNPLNPQIPYTMAKIALSKTEPDEAIVFAERAIDLKNDYVDALMLLAQMEENRGDHQKAVLALEKTIQVIPDYADAKYFLGLSYFNLGRTEDALKEFADIEKLNPGRQDITQIIRNLQNGYAPFSAPTPKETPALFIASTTEKEKFSHKER